MRIPCFPPVVILCLSLLNCSRTAEQPPRPAADITPVNSLPRIIPGPEMLCLKAFSTTPLNRCEVVEKDIAKCAATIRQEVTDEQQREATLGAYYLNSGQEKMAVEHYRRAYELAVSRDTAMASKWPSEQLPPYVILATDALFELGVAQMRWGEAQNCVQNHHPESCVFPLSSAARHADETGSRQALASFTEYLKLRPDDETAGWLLNVVAQTIGEHPKGVPPKFLVSAKDIRSEIKFPKFSNVAPALGFDGKSLVGGVALDDFNNDGLIDVVISSVGPCDPVQFYQNAGDGKFTDRSIESGLGAQFAVGHMVQADFDNDGWLDLYGTRGIWNQKVDTEAYGVDVYNVLLRNVGGRFTDVTTAMGLKMIPHYNVASIWGDYDNDGFVDLFVCSGAGTAAVLYRNDQGKRFVDVTASSRINNVASCLGAAWGDVNNDGWIDLYTANLGGPNRLFLNTKGVFSLDAQPVLRAKPMRSFTAFFFDFNNDGWLDLFVSAWDGRFEGIGSVMRKQATNIETARIFQNVRGRFKDVTAQLQIPRSILVMAANFGDLDNDGFPDMYLGTGGPAFKALIPNIMYKNVGGRRFADVTAAGGFGNLQKGHGIGFSDLDNDGDQEVVASFGGWFESDRYMPSVFDNPGFGNHFLTLRLVGTRSNRSAIGSRVRATFREDGRRRVVYQTVGSGGSFGSGSLQVEMGIGKAVEVEELEIIWAGSHSRSVFRHVSADRILTITEGDIQYQETPMQPFALAATSATATLKHVH